MKKTKLLTSLAAFVLVLGLGACDQSKEETSSDESEGTTQSSETTGETTGGEEESKTTPAPEEGRYFLGFDVDGTINYINGETVSGYDYEGKLTTEIGYAVPVTLAAADGDDAYYLTFELDEATYYVCIITLDTGYVDLQYTTEANAIYWDETHAAWVNEEDTYFLCYNSAYSCAYASDFDTWWGSSPVGELFDIPEGWEPLEPEELPSSEVTYVGDVAEGTYKFGAFDTNSWSYLYISTGVSTASNHYLIPTSDWTYGANISITSYEDGYTLSYELGEETRYITYTGSSTAVTTSTQPYVWYYDSENAVFTSAAESGRFLGLAANADAFRAYSYDNDNLTKYAHAIPYTTEPVPEENPNEGDNEFDETKYPVYDSSAYHMGVYDPVAGTYRYLSNVTNSNSSTSVDWNEGIDISVIREVLDDSVGYAFKFQSGNYTDYIAYNSSTSIKYSSSVYYWEYDLESGAFLDTITGNSGRFLGFHTGQSSTPIGAFAASNLPAEGTTEYVIATLYSEKPADDTYEPDNSYTQVAFLTSGQEYYLGDYSNGQYKFITGSFSNNRFSTTTDIDSAVTVTATGSDTDGWTLTIGEQYVYAYQSGSYNNFGLSSDDAVPSSGVNTFLWDETTATLYTAENALSGGTGTVYTYYYFEFYSDLVCLYGSNSLSFSNVAHFYQAAA